MAELLDSGDTPAIECTLGTDDVPERLREWRAVLDRVETRQVTPQGITLRFPLDAHGAWLAIGAPAEAKAMVIDLFGSNDR